MRFGQELIVVLGFQESEIEEIGGVRGLGGCECIVGSSWGQGEEVIMWLEDCYIR